MDELVSFLVMVILQEELEVRMEEKTWIFFPLLFSYLDVLV